METFLQSKEVKVPKSHKVHPSKIDFKSSFARSLTFNNDSHYDTSSKSLDFEINLQQCSENENASCDKDEDLVVGNFNESFNKSDEDKERQLWSKQRQHQQVNKNIDPFSGDFLFSFRRAISLFSCDPNKHTTHLASNAFYSSKKKIDGRRGRKGLVVMQHHTTVTAITYQLKRNKALKV